jgi:hypothetical protein
VQRSAARRGRGKRADHRRDAFMNRITLNSYIDFSSSIDPKDAMLPPSLSWLCGGVRCLKC